MTNQVPFMGYTIFGKGKQPDDQNVNKSLKMLPPSYIKEVEQFCVLVDFYHRFIAKTSHLRPDL